VATLTNKIGWCDKTINPITGCLNGCNYCYARKMAYRLKGRFGYPENEPFRPTFHPDKLQEIYNLCGTHKRIFLDSMGDWFSDGIDPAWINLSINAISKLPNHTFIVLTKRPDNIWYRDFPDNLWVGISVTCQEDVWRVRALKIHFSDTIKHMFVSFEPLHGPIQTDLSGIDWVIIGAESGNRKGKIMPDIEWVRQICEYARGKPVFLKDNLRSIMSMGIEPPVHLRQEFPDSMVVP
jgi:protein gp37